MRKTNIVLIGMPGSGKSTMGKYLSERLNYQFYDGDELIERESQMSIQNVMDQYGSAYFAALESKVLRELDVNNAVISTGGSAVYSHETMEKLAVKANLVYLRITEQTLISRIDNFYERGLMINPGQTLSDLYKDRVALYPRYADIIFDNDAPFSISSAESLIASIDAL